MLSAFIPAPAQGEILPANAVFQCSYHEHPLQSVALFNEAGQPVVAKRTDRPMEDFYYIGFNPYATELRPVTPLAAGTYELQVRTTRGVEAKQRFVVGNEVDHTVPLAPEKLSAKVELADVYEMRANDWASVFVPAKRKAVIVRATIVERGITSADNLLYELKWGPMVSGKYELVWQKSVFDIKPELIGKVERRGKSSPKDKPFTVEIKFVMPLKCFESLESQDQQLHFQLIAIDKANNRSKAAETRLKTGKILKLLKVEKEKAQ